MTIEGSGSVTRMFGAVLLTSLALPGGLAANALSARLVLSKQVDERIQTPARPSDETSAAEKNPTAAEEGEKPPSDAGDTGSSSNRDAEAAAVPAESGIAEWVRTIEVTGFVDAYFSVFPNHPSGDAPLRNFDTRHNQFSFNLAEIALERKVTAAERLGFRLDFGVGPTAER